jgi:endonuclease/exonuclease/phosphatase family metal-dependent hydrolase
MATQPLTLTTFNVENLFNRYALLDQPWQGRDYEKMVQAIGLVSIASREGDLVSYATTEIQRNNTAQAILDSRPDVLAVQEVENLYTLRLFNAQYLDDYFDRMVLVDGNDPRGIDVGVMLRTGFKGVITAVRTHIDEPVDPKKSVRRGSNGFGYLATGALFSRDCLEVDIEFNHTTLTLLVNHFKAQDGTPAAIARRKRQATRVAELAAAAAAEKKHPVVLGDLNVDGAQKDGSLDPLLKAQSSLLPDPFPAGTWTHYYTSDKKISRLDYILPHKDLEVSATKIVRMGLTTKCKQYTGPRYPTIGQEHTEASDHCPTTVVLQVG